VQTEIPELEGATRRRVAVRGIGLSVAELGDPAAPPLLLVHGWPQHGLAWRKLTGPLSESHRVIVPDLRGFGRSDAPPSGYEKRELARDMLALIEALELGPVRWAGHDWGGLIGYFACFERPELISHLLAIGVSHPWARRETGAGAMLRSLWRLNYMVALATPLLGPRALRDGRLPRLALVKGAARREDAWQEGELEPYVEQWRDPRRAAAGSAVYRTFLTRELPALARGAFSDERVEVPTVLLTGDRDPVIRPETLGGWERNAPRMRVEVLAGIGHWIPEEAPEATLRVARELFAA
jgi:pimeloyl-ACP methyl ester carboxylesterase